MSRVFNAKRKEVTAEYEFLDGRTASFKVVSLSTNESRELSQMQNQPETTLGDFVEKQARFMLQKNEETLSDEIMLEQMSEGNILEFSKALVGVIEEEVKQKGND